MKKAKTTAVIESEIVENMDAAASRLGIERADVRRAKKSGCSAFMPGGRIHVPQLGAWLEANPAPPAASIPATGPTPPPRPPLPPISDAERLKLSSLEASLASSVEDEVECHRMLKAAREAGDVAALPYLHKAMALARRNRVVAEAAVDRIKIERGQLIPEHLHKAQLFRMWSPIISLMRAMPRKVASHLVNLDDVEAERVLAKAVEEMLAEMHRHLGKPEPVMMAESCNIWIEGQLSVDPSGVLAIEELDQLRAKTLAAIAARQAGSPSMPTNGATILTTPTPNQ